ncbi:MAG TPA: hypothetical protein VL866_13340 [Pyrinomonadaceae bacterium]|nr:hypothetical protein [Pyrinomonadaceae bacterium]
MSLLLKLGRNNLLPSEWCRWPISQVVSLDGVLLLIIVLALDLLWALGDLETFVIDST